MAPLLSRVKARLPSRGKKTPEKSDDVGTENPSAEPIAHPGNPLSQTLVTPTSSSNVDLQSQAVEALSTGQKDNTANSDVLAPPLSPAQELWNRAYNAVKEQEPALVDSYERILSFEMQKDDSDRDLSHVPNLIQQNSEAKRWLQMEQLVQTRLAKLEKEDKVKGTTGTVLQATLSFKDAINLAVQSVPQAALAWAGICFALQLSTNPVTESQSRRDGTAHVMARMKWYQQLSALLRQDDAAYLGPLVGLQAQLENEIVTLFKQVILYLIKSVCSSFRNRFSVVLRDMLKIDDWVGSLTGVEDAECAVRRDYSVLDVQDIKLKLERLVESASRQERALLHDQADQKCFQHLHVTDPRDDKVRIEQTKGGLLQDSYQWILDNAAFRKWREHRKSQIFWIKGDPGKGKTMLLCGIIDELKKPGAYNGHLSFFFCQATDDRINSATAVLRGLIFLLIDQQPSLILHVRKKYDQAGQSLFQDRNAWVALSEIFTNILRDPQLKDTYLIVDALDECMDDRTQLLDLLIHESSFPSRVKWIVSSRNWPEIEERLELAETKTSLCLELNAQSVSDAVNTYIGIKVHNLAKLKGYDTATRNAVQKYLLSNADNTFLWVALACEYLVKVPKYRALSSLKLFLPGLEPFYGSMVQHMRSSDGSDVDLLGQILGLVATVYRPITIAEMKTLIELPEEMSSDFEPLQDMIGRCGSFLTIRERTIYFVHQSAKDFLLQKCNPPVFASGEEGMHYRVFQATLRGMSVALHRDIYRLRAPGIYIERIQQPNPDPLDPIRYSCVYWVEHLVRWIGSQSPTSELDDEYLNSIDVFLKTKYIYWLEALSLIQAFSEGVLAILQLENVLQSQKPKPKTIELLRDAHRFILHNRWLIENYPLQTYDSALIFSPTRSLIRRTYTRELPTWIRTSPRVQNDWSACLFKVEAHEEEVGTVVFSPDGKLLASRSSDASDGTVRIWHAVTGQLLHTLDMRDTPAPSMVFSHDSKYIASSSCKEIDIWSMDSGKRLRTLDFVHRNYDPSSRLSLAFSSDNKSLIVLTSTPSLETWEIASCKCSQIVVNHPGFTIGATLYLSGDGRRFASAERTAVKVWDVESEACSRLFEPVDHDDYVLTCLFSPDGKCLAVAFGSAVSSAELKIWDIDSGICIMTPETSALMDYLPIAISHDNRLIAFTENFVNITIWDIASGGCLLNMKGGRCGQFSHNSSLFASGSYDGTVGIWDFSDLERVKEFAVYSEQEERIDFSWDKMLVASQVPDEETIRIWNVAANNLLRTIEPQCHRIQVSTAADLANNIQHSAARFSSDGRFIALGSDEGAIQIWTVLGDKCYRVLEGHGAPALTIVFSQDGCYLAAHSTNEEIAIWNVANGDCLHLVQDCGMNRSSKSICFSNDGRLFAYSTMDNMVKVLKVTTGQCTHTFEASAEFSGNVTFSNNSQRLLMLSGQNASLSIWNLLNGAREFVQQYEIDGYAFDSVVFSHDDRYFGLSSHFRSVEVCDAVNGKCLQKFDIDMPAPSLSFDGTCSYLLTTMGAFKLDLAAASAAVQNGEGVKMLDRHGYGFDIDGHWITHHSERLLWLPSDFRPNWQSAIQGSTVFLGRVNRWGPQKFDFVDSEELSRHLGRDTSRLDKTSSSNGEESVEDSLDVD